LRLEDIVFVFMDVETTGLYVQFGDRICEIAMLKWWGGEDVDHYHNLINPEKQISPGAAAVNHITYEMVRDAPVFPEIIEQVLDFIDGTVLVAHNAPFDMGFFQTQLEISGFPPVSNPVIDTLSIARKYYNFPGNSLGKIARYYGLDIGSAHRAMADVILTKQIFKRFLDDLKKHGIRNLTDLLVAQTADIQESNDKEILPPDLQEAIAGNRPLKIKYADASGKISKRIIEPIQVSAFRDYVYLVAFCHLRQEQRTFRLDRILWMKSE
jgi:DNA polymerase III epsilon subunit family exonuclease